MVRGRWNYKPGALVCLLMVVLIHLWGSKVYGAEITLLAPNGGDIIPSGSSYSIDWTASPGIASYSLQYSLDKGKKWKTIEKGITDTSYAWDVPTPTSNKEKCLIRVMAYNAAGKKLATDKSDAPFTIEVMNITAPIVGEILPSGVTYNVTWYTNGTKKPIKNVKLFCSIDNGKKWKLMANEIGDPGGSTCVFPIPTKNENDCLVKVVAYDDANQKVATDTVDSPFTIEVVHLTSPDGGEILKSGGTHIISWTTNETKRDVHQATCSYTQNGGKKWKKIKTESGNPGFYYWQVPNVSTTKKKCKVKVELKDAKGKNVGTDSSDAHFRIEQDPFVFAEVIDNDQPILAMATDDVDAIGVLGDRNFAGNPITVTGIVYLFEQGEAGTVAVGLDGLPESFTDDSNNRVVFENYTEDTVDITLFDSTAYLVEGPITVDVVPEDIATIKALYVQALDETGSSDCEIHNRLTHALRYASYTSSWGGCIIYTAMGDLFNGSQACFSALSGNIAALTNAEADDVFSFSIDGALCDQDPISCLAVFNDESAPRIGQCGDLSGSWHGYDEGWIKCTIDGKTEKDKFKTSGTQTIYQTGCSVKWFVEGEIRNGKVDGNKVTASGKFMKGGSKIKFKNNKITAKMLICGDEFTFTSSGNAKGRAYGDGAWHNFTCTLKSAGAFSRVNSISAFETTAGNEEYQTSPATMLGIGIDVHDLLKITESDRNQ